MDSSLYKNKSGILEVVSKAISQSNLFERTIENNKKAIKVHLKNKSDLIYQDLTPNKERTKKIMSNFLKPSTEKKKEITHNRVLSENYNKSNEHTIHKILAINNKTNSAVKKFEKEREKTNNYASNNNLENKNSINHNNIHKTNIANNLIKVKTNNLYTINHENNNNVLNTIYKNSHYNESKKMFDTVQNSFDMYNNNNGEYLNTIGNENFHSINTMSLSNGKKKNIITKRIILTQSDNNLLDSYQNQKTNTLINNNNNDLRNQPIKKSQLKKSNSSFITRNSNNSFSKDVVIKDNSPTTTLKIEDLIVLEEKLSKIIDNFKHFSQLKALCIEWYNFYTYCSFYNVFEDFFPNDQYNDKVISHEYSVLEFLSIIVIYQVLKDQKVTQSTLNLLNKLINCVYQNFLIVCDYIISILPVMAQKRTWVEKLQSILNKKKEYKINKNEHLNSLRIGNNNISILLKTILRLYNNNNTVVNGNELMFYLSRSTRIYISTLNEYFKKKIYMDENNISKDYNILKENNQKSKIQNIRESIKNKTPYLQNKKDKKKVFTLVLDLDETIISYKKDKRIFIPRPGLNQFLTEISKLYEIILFTSAKQEYADPIIDLIDKDKIFFEKRLYRQHALLLNDTFVKDLTKLGRDLSKIIILDNRPQSYSLQKENGIYIKSFLGDDKYDNALIDLIPILKKIASNSYNDVRKEIKKMKNEILMKVTTNLNDEK